MGLAKDMGGLGLHDMHSFNLVLRLKQVWRILKEHNSFVSKVFQQKYFPNVSFLQAKTSYMLSYVWRSLLTGKELFSKCLI